MIRPPNRLYSKNFTAARDRAGALSEAADQEVHRDQHGLEEHVEQQHVQRDHRDQHHRLDGQRQRDVGVHAAGALAAVVPAGHQQQRNQHRGQQHQHHRDAVHAEGVTGAERRYPPMAFDELVSGAAGLEADRDDDRHRQRQHADDQAGPLGELSQPRGQQDDQHGTRQRHQPQHAQPRDVEFTTPSPPGSLRPPAPRPPAWTRRSCGRSRSAIPAGRFEVRLTSAASALTEPSTPALSTSTSASVSCAPGRMNTSSLKASP